MRTSIEQHLKSSPVGTDFNVTVNTFNKLMKIKSELENDKIYFSHEKLSKKLV